MKKEKKLRDGETSVSRIGTRIRKIRVEKGITQAELGERVGLNADRIQKYENGARKPKNDMLKNIATALGVSASALADPNTTSFIGAMYAFFDLEDGFNMKIKKIKDDDGFNLCLAVNNREEMYQYMEEWYEVYIRVQEELKSAGSQEEKDAILKTYHEWKWNFPQGIIIRKLLLKIRSCELCDDE